MINKKFKKGFTLVETLGAVMLLSIALVGPMVIAQKGLQASLIAKDQNTAYNLAQDAVEFIRFARDTNCLAAANASLTPCPVANWLSGGALANTINLTPCVSSDGSAACYFDTVNASGGVLQTPPTACGTNPCTTVINYDSANNDLTYAASGGSISPTIFTRTVQIRSNCLSSCATQPVEASTTVTVSWSDPVAHSVVVNESLYDWQ